MKIQGITIHKNKKCNTWFTRYRKDGKQYYISAKTQKECYNLLKEQLNIIKKERKGKAEYTFDSWYQKWLELFKIGKIKQITLDDYKHMLKYVPAKIQNTNIKKITEINIQEIISNIPFARQRQKVFGFLKDIFDKAYKYKAIDNDIFCILEKPKYEAESGIALTEEEQKQLIECALKKEKYFVFLVALWQGLRKGEVLGLTKENLNFEKKTITIDKALTAKNKFDTTKNTYSERTIPMFDATYNLLKNLDIKTNARVFKVNYKQIQDWFKSLLKESGIKDIRIHDLRHTFITNLKNINIPEHIIQKYVGHSIGSKVTNKVYTHVNEDKLKENTLLINEKFYSNSTQKKED